MDMSRFAELNGQMKEKLASVVDEILKSGSKGLFGKKGNKVQAIGFITTDDFYGFYVTWSSKKGDINNYYDWKNALYPEFLYQPLVDVVDSTKDIDLLRKSDEKWEFAEALLTVLGDNINTLPSELFERYGCRREDILFFATMSDGDYIAEMLECSLELFNPQRT